MNPPKTMYILVRVDSIDNTILIKVSVYIYTRINRHCVFADPTLHAYSAPRAPCKKRAMPMGGGVIGADVDSGVHGTGVSWNQVPQTGFPLALQKEKKEQHTKRVPGPKKTQHTQPYGCASFVEDSYPVLGCFAGSQRAHHHLWGPVRKTHPNGSRTMFRSKLKARRCLQPIKN